jgi:hypothetical protein
MEREPQAAIEKQLNYRGIGSSLQMVSVHSQMPLPLQEDVGHKRVQGR